jgi:starvation-inducible DNA-binding protein
MPKQHSIIGLDEKLSIELGKELNLLLSNYQIFYQNLRGFHWNIKGKEFFELHAKFEELYNDAVLKIDEIAERILTLGSTPLHSFTDFLALTEVKEAKNIAEGKKAVSTILENIATLIKRERKILALSGEAEDEGTNSLMSDYIKEQEKLAWMLNAYLNE